jgi:Type I phosphodiesterase / nucleotide pyrophosphatase
VSVSAMAVDGDNDGRQAKHVLLISVDGMHALDLANYVAAHPNSTLAQLSAHGKTYTNATTSQPSDSFPGLAGLVTGGSPAPVLQIAAGNVFYPSFWGFQSRLAPAVTNYM